MNQIIKNKMMINILGKNMDQIVLQQMQQKQQKNKNHSGQLYADYGLIYFKVYHDFIDKN